MNTFQTLFSKLSAKSQPEVGLSQEIAGMKEVNHQFDNNNNNEYSYYIPIPTSTIQQQQLPINAMAPDMNINSYGLSTTISSFGSFSSAADSLIHENQAIFIPNDNNNNNYTTNQDFCLMDDPILISTTSSSNNNELSLLSTSNCESDISFCSPSTPHHGMLSPFPNYQGSSPSPALLSTSSCSSVTSPGTLLANAMNQGLNLQSTSSPSTTPLINVHDIMLSPSLSSYPPFSPLTNASLDQFNCPSPSPSFFSINQYQQQHDDSISIISNTIDNSNNNQEWSWDQWHLIPESNPIINDNTSLNLFDINLSYNNNDNSTGTMMINIQDNEMMKNKKKSTMESNNKKKVIKKQPIRHGKHKCPYCPRTSNRSNNMKEHILTHNPNRPKNFACERCPKRFARKHDLKRHHDSHIRNMQKFIKDWGFIPYNTNLNQEQQEQQQS